MDVRLVPLAISVWVATLAVPGLPVELTVGCAVALAGAAVGVLLLDRRHPRAGTRRRPFRPVAVVLLGAAVGATVTGLHVAAARAGPIPGLVAEAAVVTAELRVRTDPVRRQSEGSRRPPYVLFTADVEWVRAYGTGTRTSTPVVVTASREWQAVAVGERIRAVGRLAGTDPGDRAAAIFSARSPPSVRAAPGTVTRTANHLRAGLREAVAGLPPAERGLVPALVVGDTSAMPPDLVADFQTAGLTHLTAVSGSNLTILMVTVVGVARFAGVRSWGIGVVGVACVVGFVLLARPEPSVLRAAAMGLVGVVGLLVGSRRYGVPSLAIAMLGLLLIDPWLGREYGFALSVLATAGILVIAPPCTDALARWMPKFLAVAIAVPLAAQLACTPLIAVLSDAVSVVAVVANLLAAPAVLPATVLGVGTTAVAAASVPVAAVPGYLAGLAARWIVEVGTHAARVPGASLEWPTTAFGVGVLLAACLAAAVLAPRVLSRRLATLALTGALVLWLAQPARLSIPPAWLTGWPPDDWLVVACDVGQGDAVVLRAGPDSAVVVDTGSEPAAVDRCLTDLGVERVPYVLLTHFHADHVAGLAGVLDDREVGEIGIRPFGSDSTAADPAQSSDASVVGTVRAAESAGVPVGAAAVGERRRAGELTWTVLWPAAPAGDTAHLDSTTEESAENDLSVVVLAELRGVRVLLTGDLEPVSQRALLRTGVRLDADVLKVPHHGSRFQDPGFLSAIRPDLALVSVGAENDYGHPARETLDRLRADGAMVLRTDQRGAIAVVDAAGLGVVTEERARSP